MRHVFLSSWSFLGILLATSGCFTTTVNLTTRNADKIPFSLRVTSFDDRNLNRSETEYGTIAPGETRILPPFKIKNGGHYELVARLPDSAVVFREPRPVTGTPSPQNDTIDVAVRLGRLLDDTRALQTISDSF